MCVLSLTSWTGTEPSLIAHREKLLDTLQSYGRVAVAYSGGIDSTVVAQAAYAAIGDAAIAVTAFRIAWPRESSRMLKSWPAGSVFATA